MNGVSSTSVTPSADPVLPPWGVDKVDVLVRTGQYPYAAKRFPERLQRLSHKDYARLAAAALDSGQASTALEIIVARPESLSSGRRGKNLGGDPRLAGLRAALLAVAKDAAGLAGLIVGNLSEGDAGEASLALKQAAKRDMAVALDAARLLPPEAWGRGALNLESFARHAVSLDASAAMGDTELGPLVGPSLEEAEKQLDRVEHAYLDKHAADIAPEGAVAKSVLAWESFVSQEEKTFAVACRELRGRLSPEEGDPVHACEALRITAWENLRAKALELGLVEPGRASAMGAFQRLASRNAACAAAFDRMEAMAEKLSMEWRRTDATAKMWSVRAIVAKTLPLPRAAAVATGREETSHAAKADFDAHLRAGRVALAVESALAWAAEPGMPRALAGGTVSSPTAASVAAFGTAPDLPAYARESAMPKNAPQVLPQLLKEPYYLRFLPMRKDPNARPKTGRWKKHAA